MTDYTLVEDIQNRLDPEDGSWLFLEPHPEFPGMWLVESFDSGFYFDFEELIGPYRAVAPAGLPAFLDLADDKGYQVAFFEDPFDLLTSYERLNEPPPFDLNSNLPDTVGGFLPYQLQGFNFLKELDGGVAMWSTGTGKTVLGSALFKYHLEAHTFDVGWFICKAHNKVNTQRALKRLAGLDSTVIEGSKDARKRQYREVADVDGPSTLVTNYDKFRNDQADLLPLFDGRRVFIIWDEMPTKLKTRTTKLYKAICSCLYTTTPPAVSFERIRPSSLRQYMLSATPIEVDPEDWFNCVRLLDPRVYGTVREFEDEYVSSYSFFDSNKPETWVGLNKMGLKAAHITHQVDKSDPDIAKYFPKFSKEDFYIDWDEKDRVIYDYIADNGDLDDGDEINILSMITLLQMMCDAPEMLSDSAAFFENYVDALEGFLEDDDDDVKEPARKGSEAAWKLLERLPYELSNKRHTKSQILHELLCEKHADEKAVIFTASNYTLMPYLEGWLNDWGVTYVRYEGTQRQRQEAEDRFREDPDIRTFLTSDKGSDSINLEKASVLFNYNLPWNWSRTVQRDNRVHRITSQFGAVRSYNLLMANSVEDRKKDIIERKKSYHDGVFKGAIADQSMSARMTKEDLLFILRG